MGRPMKREETNVKFLSCIRILFAYTNLVLMCRTSQRLQQRITQHVPKSVRGGHTFQDRTSLARSCKPIKSLNTEISSSAIGQHLLHNQLCAQNYSDDKFSILAHGRTAFHLLTLEATYIKTSKPNLCKQKEFVYSLKILH